MSNNLNNPNNIKLAVVIPCYNEEENIEKVIISYQNQYNKDFDLILVDNNSKDNTINIIQHLQNTLELPIILLLEKEQGVSSARKCGYDYCLSNEYTHVVSADADTEVGEHFISKYYNAFENGYEVISGDSNWDCTSQIPFKNIQNLLRSKSLIESLIVEIYDDKMDGFNSGFSLEAYRNVGGLDIMRYIYRDKIYQSASDDWCLHAKFMMNNYEMLSLDTKDEVTVNFRKYLTSINKMIDGTLYDKGWEDLNAQEITENDITEVDMRLLFQKFSRSAIVNFMLMHCYLDNSMLRTPESVDLLGYDLSNRIENKIYELRQIYPYNKYNDQTSYFAPAIHLYFTFGEEITDKINDYLQDDYDQPLQALNYIEYPKISKIKTKNNVEMDDQLLYLVCISEDVLDFFSEN